MKFGIGLFGMQTHPCLNYSNKDIYDNTFEQALNAENHGFESAWLSEHHFLEDGYYPLP
jgi:alkanesulfonate monooxygenase SsuD/methylene tetrahydromethanopterin reductase-like flavin-dependent oxidoreductase (luciferase family)